MFMSLGATYNKSKGNYEYFGITDLSLGDLIASYNETYGWWRGPQTRGSGSGKDAKFIFKPNCFVESYYNIYNLMQAFNNLAKITIVDLSPISQGENEWFHRIAVLSLDYIFQGSRNIKEIRNVFDVSACTDLTKITRLPFLETIYLKGAKVDIVFGGMPRISKESVKYAIDNATPTKALTITLHPDAYSRLIADKDIIDALAKQPLISLAEETV